MNHPLTAKPLRQLAPRSLVNEATESLRCYVLDGHLASGDEFPSQGQLCEELGVSRSVIREAMKTLQSQGLIEISQGRLPRVLPAEPTAVIDTLGMLMRRSDISLLQLVEVRRPLELEIAELAARRAEQKHIAELRESVDALHHADDLATQVSADVRFHKTLADASGNPLFGIVLDVFAQLLHESRRRTLAQSGKNVALSYHRRILSAVEERDAVKARDLMSKHMAQTKKTSHRIINTMLPRWRIENEINSPHSFHSGDVHFTCRDQCRDYRGG